MKIIYKTNKNYRNAKSVLFGLKDLSTYENEITLENLKNIKNKEIFLAIDKNIFDSDLEYLESVLKKIDNFNIKGIFFYDLAVLNLAKKHNLKTPLIWNQNFLVTNYKTCNFYQKEGIKGAVLSSEITIEEIEEIAKNTSLDLFLNIFGFQLMAISKRNLITNYFKFLKVENDKQINYMMQKDEKYPVIESKIGTKFYTKDILNGIKYINRLKKSNIKYIILDDNLIDEKVFKEVADIYEEVVKKDFTEQELQEKEKIIKKLLSNTSTLFLDKKTIYKVKRK
ncbi:MAG: U32 family peptidase [Bacilli bacterium]